jgi:hypothetical protein
MRLSTRDIVRAWDWGQDKHPVDRALILLALACPELSHDTLADLTVGQRNGRLLALRERTLGPTLRSLASCESCGAALEFAVPIAALSDDDPAALEHSLEHDGFRLRFRLPTSRDLAAVVGLDPAEAGRQLLVERCVLAAEYDGQPVAVGELPDALTAVLAEAVGDQDPLAEKRLRLTCAECGHRWSALFDIAAFFWTELDGVARRLMGDVATLARSYGWGEAEILAMSAARRQLYLEMAN